MEPKGGDSPGRRSQRKDGRRQSLPAAASAVRGRAGRRPYPAWGRLRQLNQMPPFSVVVKDRHTVQFPHVINLTVSERDKQTSVPKVIQREARGTAHPVCFGKRNQSTPAVIRLLETLSNRNTTPVAT